MMLVPQGRQIISPGRKSWANWWTRLDREAPAERQRRTKPADSRRVPGAALLPAFGRSWKRPPDAGIRAL